jgi:hypothetical protein
MWKNTCALRGIREKSYCRADPNLVANCYGSANMGLMRIDDGLTSHRAPILGLLAAHG